jgi:hypothetical protein
MYDGAIFSGLVAHPESIEINASRIEYFFINLILLLNLTNDQDNCSILRQAWPPQLEFGVI